MNEELSISEMARRLGALGGKKKSIAKTLSCRKNAARPRPNRRKKLEKKNEKIDPSI